MQAHKLRMGEQHPIIHDFIALGHHHFEGGLDASAAGRLLEKIRHLRTFGEDLFLTEAEFDANPQYIGVNPQVGRNLLEPFEADLAFVEQDTAIVSAMTSLLGEGYEILLKKLICGVPAGIVPAWLKARIAGNPVNNLGAYIKPQFRDITYFYGIDFHQDLIDYKDREADFVTLYVYLHDVLLCDGVYDYIKMDVESTELKVILGGIESLNRATCIAVASYHLSDDIVSLPTQLRILLKDDVYSKWDLYFTHSSQTFDDSIFFFVKTSR